MGSKLIQEKTRSMPKTLCSRGGCKELKHLISSITYYVRYGSTIGESSGGLPTRSLEVNAVRRWIRLWEGEKIVIVSSIHEGVSKHEGSKRKTRQNMQRHKNEYNEDQTLWNPKNNLHYCLFWNCRSIYCSFNKLS